MSATPLWERGEADTGSSVRSIGCCVVDLWTRSPAHARLTPGRRKDPRRETKGSSEVTVSIAKADLIPTTANLCEKYSDFNELREACAIFCQQVNTHVHRETGKTPASMLDIERSRLHPLSEAPHTLALGESRQVLRDRAVRFGSGRAPPHRAWLARKPGFVRTARNSSSWWTCPGSRAGRSGCKCRASG
ncbi:hypothetical protein [Streptomyces sp. MS2.AVA.5]|uniref:Uncharacterized protein n=1 Tax=Streptomyces achmelvichensis TaxID=3134111 RepID=A0ACC6PNJ4_9ACTN